jgi:hypothetical protein
MKLTVLGVLRIKHWLKFHINLDRALRSGSHFIFQVSQKILQVVWRGIRLESRPL